ncbi:hypothetical protein OEZ86_006231 [Tetradesmus obliquus]|nr:hypothetical protein OEZ86_006231 [Tetradesmus obliquus]
MAEVLGQLNRVWQQVEAFDWDAQAWSQQERKDLHKGLCKHGDDWDQVAHAIPSRSKNEVVLAAIKLMVEEPDFLQGCGPELQPRLRRYIQQHPNLRKKVQQQQQQPAVQQPPAAGVLGGAGAGGYATYSGGDDSPEGSEETVSSAEDETGSSL